ncbi:MAG TPA: hypothetical protein VJR27_03660 [Candidatus Saccharimonadales bacterium]|nr:hypothetical protein [Candidatus Saccharimonadales bacterium]
MAQSVLAVRGEAGGPVGLALTGAAYSMANELGIDEIRPDITAMAEIADCVGRPMPGDKLPPLLVVARATLSGPSLRRDTELPTHEGQGLSAMYHFAYDISSESAHSTNREQLVRAARFVGAKVLTEVSIVDWRQPVADHVKAFAAGLVLSDAQKPLDLPPAPSLLDSVATFFLKGAVIDRRELALLERTTNNPALRSPFIFKDRSGNELELGR